ncbi:hypothetical protein [Maridesulfovibrio sp.]|uniref:hypothetical protein n=1 Tax=Maridesulfovibrio sp. TaxID=2795000 RepID=UPI002A187724|nr:hypothetical protein [Maridesulfovibrio sp.]
MIRISRTVLFWAVMFILSGCIGGKSVDPVYLRVAQGAAASCEKIGSGLPRVALKHFTSLPALNSETVILADGNVLKPDYRWSWEGTPAEIFDLAAGPGLGCMKHFEVVTPYRPGVERTFILSGVITSFELHRDGGDRFLASVRYSLWDGEGRILLARREVECAVPVKSIDGQAVTEAAGMAVDGIMVRTAGWMDGLSGTLSVQGSK